jgi:hypothetical protein
MAEKRRRTVKSIQPVPVVEGAGVKLRRTFPTQTINYLDPFLLLDDFSSDNPEDFAPGFPWHPHRGIETVTYILSGRVDHQDSLGNGGQIGAGDVQWMTAGGGIMHQEMPQVSHPDLVGFQLWVNLPARLKMTSPRYQDVPAGSIPEIIGDGGARIRIIAGELDGVRGPVTQIAISPSYFDVDLPAGTSGSLPVTPEHTALIYVFRGGGAIGRGSSTGQDEVRAPILLVLGDGNTIDFSAGPGGMRFLLIAGQPLREPIARYGPFVMNTAEEIEQALADLRNGTFIRPQPASDSPQWYGMADRPTR